VKRIEKLKEVINKLKQINPSASTDNLNIIHTRASQLLLQANKFKGDTRDKIILSNKKKLNSNSLNLNNNKSFSMFTVHSNDKDNNENPSFSSFKEQAFITDDNEDDQ